VPTACLMFARSDRVGCAQVEPLTSAAVAAVAAGHRSNGLILQRRSRRVVVFRAHGPVTDRLIVRVSWGKVQLWRGRLDRWRHFAQESGQLAWIRDPRQRVAVLVGAEPAEPGAQALSGRPGHAGHGRAGVQTYVPTTDGMPSVAPVLVDQPDSTKCGE